MPKKQLLHLMTRNMFRRCKHLYHSPPSAKNYHCAISTASVTVCFFNAGGFHHSFSAVLLSSATNSVSGFLFPLLSSSPSLAERCAGVPPVASLACPPSSSGVASPRWRVVARYNALLNFIVRRPAFRARRSGSVAPIGPPKTAASQPNPPQPSLPKGQVTPPRNYTGEVLVC